MRGSQRIAGWMLAALAVGAGVGTVAVEAAQRAPVAAAPAPAAPAAPAFDQAMLEGTVRVAYGKLVGYLRAADVEARVVLSGFRTVPAAEFDRLAYTEAVSLPGVPVLHVVRVELGDRQRGRTGTHFRGALHQADPEASARWRSSVEGGSFGAALRRATDEPQLADARALTTFEVRRTIDGTTDVYRAAFLWLAAADGSNLRAYPLDPFTEGVDLALAEGYRAQAEPLQPLSPREACLLAGGDHYECDEGGQCNESTSNYSSPWVYHVGGENHNTGGHSLSFRTNFTCSCTADCVSRCTPAPEHWCVDSQDISGIDSFHKAVGAVAYEYGSVQQGNLSGASCAGGVGCVVRQCLTSLFCSLSVSVSVSYGGVGMSFSPTDNVVWDRSLQENHTCGTCETASPPPPPPPPPGGGGGGGDPDVAPTPDSGGGSSWWYADCGADGSIDYYFIADDWSEAWDLGNWLCNAE